ncbi:Uncharacterised protein [Serratia ficaria]|uniref:PASTA domain-containing protein n=1 Tax=Serratia ficaria TaxID=61651 RepID=UPI002177E2C4|nr:PASTA domain-containing protein [Serratia ficaria]CAI2091839.1 Uncharacterised protein [Serratia ficaria]CAI2463442.1 Uncharacterised protein [Serratia ficaria]
MKKKLLACLVLAMGTMTGAAHAQWGTMSSAVGHATVTADATWSIAEQTAGKWKTDGTSQQALVMKVTNDKADTAGRFALDTDAANHDANGWFITKTDDATKKINLKVDDAKLGWDATRQNYKYSDAVAKGNSVVLSFTPKDGQTLEAGEYQMKMNLLVEHP